ncbi:hypothetical protein [Catellatospora sichuanensis]|uniref:hypothetical protein n=1 Tax=Catellatospora sichuanensis TaxID=1969805 RepID=UPI0011833240|nr:hypothetical protein [Catellatospora sichuanensis]
MPESIDGGVREVPRRAVLKGAGALLPGLMLPVVAGGAAAAAASPPPSGGATQGVFSAGGYTWPVAGSPGRTARGVSGVAFTLTAGHLPLAGRRVRFSISEFHAVGRSVWFEAAPGRKPVRRLGYVDLDTDAAGVVQLDPWLRLGAVPTSALGARPVLRAQLVGSETILASARLSVV